MASMRPTEAAILCYAVFCALIYAQELSICPLDAQQYPPPVHFGQEPLFQSAVKGIADALDSKSTAFPYNETSFSIGVFTASDEGLAWEYHHASSLLANSSQGATSVDADSIYRIASTSKLTTAYLFLICAGEDKWSDLIAKWVPELLDGASLTADAVVPDWNEITIGDLAGHVAGVSRDYGLFDFSLHENVLAPPPLCDVLLEAPATGVPICGYVTPNLTFVSCSSEEYIRGVARQAPVFATAYSPVYTNTAYVLVGIALERITGVPFAELFEEKLVRALGLSATSYSVPPPIDEHTIIPGSPSLSFWDADLRAFAPAGGLFSSTRDMTIIGKSILASQLLSADVTRRWLKPTSFANGLTQGVGRPWEIVRVSMPDGSVVDVYTKAGDLGAYDNSFALVPKYNMGFTLLAAADPTGMAGPTVRNDLVNLLAKTLVDAANAVAKSQAQTNFVGTYTDQTTNSSLTVAAADELPGLRLTAWVNNGSDILNSIFAQRDMRILPNHLYDGTPIRVGFTTKGSVPLPPRPFFGACYSWIDVDNLMFAGVPMGQLVFDVDADGRALAVVSLALRTTMARVAE